MPCSNAIMIAFSRLIYIEVLLFALNTERVPLGHPIILLKCYKFNMAAVSVKRSIQQLVSFLLPCVLRCMEGELEQIIMKLRLSIKDNNNYLQTSFIDIYAVFPTNFRIISYHTNTEFYWKRTVVLSQSLGYL